MHFLQFSPRDNDNIDIDDVKMLTLATAKSVSKLDSTISSFIYLRR